MKDKELLEKVQHRFTRLFKNLRDMNYLQRLDCLGLWTLEKRRNRSGIIEMFKLYKGLIDHDSVWMLFSLDTTRIGIAMPEFFSNPGISGLKNANPGIPGFNPGILGLNHSCANKQTDIQKKHADHNTSQPYRASWLYCIDGCFSAPPVSRRWSTRMSHLDLRRRWWKATATYKSSYFSILWANFTM